MSAEQSAGETPTAQTPVDITERATNPAPKPREKNPKRVAAGKLVAERTRIARQQQKKAAAEASVIIANNNAKQPPPPPDPAPENSSPLTITQWLMVGSIAVGLAGIYYKREELKVRAKTFFGEKKRPEPDPAPAPPTAKTKTFWYEGLKIFHLKLCKG